jgi:hypothetical protein
VGLPRRMLLKHQSILRKQNNKQHNTTQPTLRQVAILVHMESVQAGHQPGQVALDGHRAAGHAIHYLKNIQSRRDEYTTSSSYSVKKQTYSLMKK